jgi:hypothetical protein
MDPINHNQQNQQELEKTEPVFFYSLEKALEAPLEVIKLDLHYKGLSDISVDILQLENLEELYL